MGGSPSETTARGGAEPQIADPAARVLGDRWRRRGRPWRVAKRTGRARAPAYSGPGRAGSSAVALIRLGLGETFLQSTDDGAELTGSEEPGTKRT